MAALLPDVVLTAFLKPEELSRVLPDLHAEVELVGARGDSCWVARIPAGLVQDDREDGGTDDPCPSPMYLFDGARSLDPRLAMELPWPKGKNSRPLPFLKSKDMLGGVLAWSGKSASLLPPALLALLPVSERCFLYWDAQTSKLRRPDERSVEGYPSATKDSPFRVLHGGAPPSLLLGISSSSMTILLVQSVRDALAKIDTSMIEFRGARCPVARCYNVEKKTKDAILHTLADLGTLGAKAKAAIEPMLLLEHSDDAAAQSATASPSGGSSSSEASVSETAATGPDSPGDGALEQPKPESLGAAGNNNLDLLADAAAAGCRTVRRACKNRPETKMFFFPPRALTHTSVALTLDYGHESVALAPSLA